MNKSDAFEPRHEGWLVQQHEKALSINRVKQNDLVMMLKYKDITPEDFREKIRPLMTEETALLECIRYAKIKP
jgi:hypothetical protein